MSDSVDEYLEHMGVKGMKWGKRKSSSSGNSDSSTGKTKSQKLTSGDILDARKRQDLRGRKMEEAQAEFIVARTQKGKDSIGKIMRQREHEFLNNADVATAAKMTKGEKWRAGLSAAVIGLSVAALASSSR